MAYFCSTPFWDLSLISEPDVSACFHNTTLVFLPCVFLAFFIPVYLKKYFKMESRRKSSLSLLFKLRFGASVILSVLIFIRLGLSIPASIALVCSSAILVIVVALQVFFLWIDELRKKFRSPPIFFFWTILLVCNLATFLSSSIKIEENNTVNSVRIATFCAIFLNWILQCFSRKRLKSEEDKSPEETCSTLSILFFSWLDPLVWNGYRRPPLPKESVPPLRDVLEPARVTKAFENRLGGIFAEDTLVTGKTNPGEVLEDGTSAENVEMIDIAQIAFSDKRKLINEDGGETVSILPGHFRAFGGKLVAAIGLKLMQDVLKFVAPQILKQLIRFVQQESSEDWLGYALAVALFIVNFLQLLVLAQYWVLCYRTAMEVKTASIGVIYKKVLRLSSDSRRNYTVGQIANLVTTDADTLQDVLPSLNMVWSMPFQIFLSLYFLYQELGPSVFAGVAILILLIPFNMVTSRFSRRSQSRMIKCKDRRIRAMYEVLNNMRIIKYNAWEENFTDRVEKIRREEISFLRKWVSLKSFINFVFGSAPILVTLASFATFVAIDPENNVLTAEKVFVCISLFNLLRLPMHLLPFSITELLRFLVSVKRINRFLACKDLTPNVVLKPSEEFGENSVEIRNGSFSWGGDDEPSLPLKEVDLSIPRGSLVAVVGRVGAGKSTLLSALLGEVERVEGEVVMQSQGVAYVSQQAWIQNASVKKNILFGEDYRQEWYEKVVEACALKDDFAQLIDGEETLIGENGINLSGGQKQRVAIARAVYKKQKGADLYLLDDPLSALDSHTSKHVFEQALSNEEGLLKGCTRILVTHRTNLLRQVDYVLVIKEGKVAGFGEPGNILAAGSEISLLIEEMEKEKEIVEEENEQKEAVKKEETKVDEKVVKPTEKPMNSSRAKEKEAQKRIKDEAVLSGRVKLRAYDYFIRSFGYVNFFLILAFFAANQGVSTGATVWMAAWADDQSPDRDNQFYVGILGVFGLAQAIASFLRNLFFYLERMHPL